MESSTERQLSNQLLGLSPQCRLIIQGLSRPLDKDSRRKFQEHFLTSPVKQEFWELADRNKVQFVIGESLVGLSDLLPDGALWQEAYKNNALRIQSFLFELDTLSDRLFAKNLHWIVLENGGLVRGFFPESPGLFQFGDFDLLTCSENLPYIDQLLIKEGYQRESPDLDMANGRVEYKRVLKHGIRLGINLQVSFVARRWFSSWREPSLELLFERSSEVPGSHVRILGPEDFLLQLCIHNASHSYVRKPGIRLHMDIDWYLRSRPVNWDLFLQMVGDLDLRTVVYFALLIPKTIFSTEIPERVFQALRPSQRKECWLINFFARHKLLDEPKEMGKMEYALFLLLLYDRPSQAMRLIFPDRIWMRQHYSFSGDLLLPYYYITRLFNLFLGKG